MYIRTLGAGFSFLAFIMAACSYYLSRRNRCRELFSIRFMLVLLRSELSGSAAEMSVILSRIAPSLEASAKEFALSLLSDMDRLGLQSFEEIWRNAAMEHIDFPDERCCEALCRLGGVIGKYELEAQLSELDTVLIFINAKADELACALKTEKKLAFGLSSALGGMLVTLLI